MSKVSELMDKVKWWTEEIRVRQRSVEEAVKTLQDRQSELTRAQQDEARERENETYKKAA